ncbi:MAG: PIN domain-containing protein [Acidobacteria bacterium]|nr:PIN domain-containing protein [Acidobacteriota bacterium]
MSVECVDTNILIYVFDSASPIKHKIAGELLTSLNQSSKGAISIQVLTELYSTATRKLRHPIERSQSALSLFRNWRIHSTSHADLLLASQLQQQHQISWRDALIVNSAQQLNASILWTEDLNHNQHIGNLTIRNPLLD